MLGSWKINVDVNGMPQKVATAVGKLSEQLMGAEYTPIAYLGSQNVNGTNHAVLAEQLIVTGKDTKNVVVLIFNEKPNEMECSLVNIERVVESSGGALGGIAVDVKTDIPEDARDSFTKCFEGFVGSKVEPFALLGTQVVKGTNYIFAAQVTSVTAEPEVKASILIVNALTGEISFTDMLGTKTDALQLGYAFTWLKRQNSSLGAPLGEWP
jgi:hypothetical protein